MSLSREEFEALLQRLREEQTERSDVDGKADLPLEKKGDHAFFIRHVAALANNVEPSYLIIGVEDKTWKSIGLPGDSSLRDADQTQTRMNQILRNRLDPEISVRYRTYNTSGVVLGLVTVEGTRAPYIIAIKDQQYGGERTKGEPEYIYRGVIYVRHGANSIIANRQSEVLDIINRAQPAVAQPDEFLEANNYLDPESEDFGHHKLSERLVEEHSKTGTWGTESVAARSWVSFVFCPVDSGCEIDTVSLRAKLKPDQRIGRGSEWYRIVPRPFNEMFYSPQKATPREFLGTWQPRRSQDAEEISHFIRILPSGPIEVGCTYPPFCQRDDVRFFGFVALIGYLWQMVYLSKAIYLDAGFHGETAVLVNLIVTKGTRLADFADGWVSPFNDEEVWLSTLSSRKLKQEICSDPNIQIKQELPLADASDDEVEAMIREIARDIGAYYGQEPPRCFDCRTGAFPSTKYMSHWVR